MNASTCSRVMCAGSLGIGDGVIGPVPPDPTSEAAMLPVVEELGGDAAVLERVDWYSGALRAACPPATPDALRL